jgi:hypothetical protein
MTLPLNASLAAFQNFWCRVSLLPFISLLLWFPFWILRLSPELLSHVLFNSQIFLAINFYFHILVLGGHNLVLSIHVYWGYSWLLMTFHLFSRTWTLWLHPICNKELEESVTVSQTAIQKFCRIQLPKITGHNPLSTSCRCPIYNHSTFL